MAETVEINEELLYPGDVIRFDFLLTSANETLRSLAIKKVKAEIYADDRLDYQGSEIVTEVDKTGLAGGVREIEVFRVYAQVREYRRDAHPEIQKAGIGGIVTASLVAAMVAVVVTYACLELRGTSVTRAAGAVADIVASDASDEVKSQALETLREVSKNTGVGSGLAAFGGSLVTTAAIIGVLWAVSLGSRRGGRGDA